MSVHEQTFESRTPAAGEWPASGIEHLGVCPVCGSKDRELLLAGLRDRIFFCAPGAWDLQRCRACRAGYLDPRPSADTIGLAYAEYYTHEERPPEGPQSGLGRLRQALGNGYRNRRFGLKLRPALSGGRLLAPVLGGMKGRIDATFRFISPPRSAEAAILDIGCGNGDFLASVADAGFVRVGVEPDPKSAARAGARGLRVFERLEEVAALGFRFQHVTMNHVIEHVHDPVAVLRTCFDLLEPGGELFIATPNMDAIGARIYGHAWRGLEPPRHLVLFTVAGLRRVLGDAGFRRIRVHPQHYVWRGLSAESEQIRARSPEAERSAGHFGLRERLLARLRPELSEFITLTCRRPES